MAPSRDMEPALERQAGERGAAARTFEEAPAGIALSYGVMRCDEGCKRIQNVEARSVPHVGAWVRKLHATS